MSVALDRVDFSALSGWSEDDHADAVRAYAKTHQRFAASGPSAPAALERDLAAVLAKGDRQSARQFFESNFQPCRITGNPEAGLVTGYYEPHIHAARHQSSSYRYPIYRRPPDLVNCMEERMRGAMNGQPTHMRQTAGGLVPYPTRREIDLGALDGLSLELAYVASPIALFFLHIQGSGLLCFDDGSQMRVTYDGKNGHPYTSIGRRLIETGKFTRDELTLKVLNDWLEEDHARARDLLWVNASYIFFRSLDASAQGPIGVDGIPLYPARSLAVDAGFHDLGTPIFVTAENLQNPTGSGAFRRLMIAQDVGSAIRGAERGDIFYGSGPTAGELAGETNTPAKFAVLRPIWWPDQEWPNPPETCGRPELEPRT